MIGREGRQTNFPCNTRHIIETIIPICPDWNSVFYHRVPQNRCAFCFQTGTFCLNFCGTIMQVSPRALNNSFRAFAKCACKSRALRCTVGPLFN
jgi:hypothetical protein